MIIVDHDQHHHVRGIPLRSWWIKKSDWISTIPAGFHVKTFV